MRYLVALVLSVTFLAAPVLALACDHPKTAATMSPQQICEKLTEAEWMRSTENVPLANRQATLIAGLIALRQISLLPPAVKKIARCNLQMGTVLFESSAQVEHVAARLLDAAIPAGVQVSLMFKQKELTRYAARDPYAPLPIR